MIPFESALARPKDDGSDVPSRGDDQGQPRKRAGSNLTYEECSSTFNQLKSNAARIVYDASALKLLIVQISAGYRLFVCDQTDNKRNGYHRLAS